MEKLTIENIYISLQGKSKEELTELYWLLKDNNEPLSKNRCLDAFIIYYYNGSHNNLGLEYGVWQYTFTINKQEVTIQQLKEILQPMDNKEEQLRKEAIEEENKPKVGDLVKCKNKDSNAECVIGFVSDLHGNNYYGVGGYFYDYAEKITNQDLIKKLNKLIK